MSYHSELGSVAPPYGWLSLWDQVKKRELNAGDPIGGEGFALTMAAATVAALNNKHVPAVLLDVRRRNRTLPQPLGRDEMPAQLPEGTKWLLDITVLDVGLHSGEWRTRLEPEIELNYRVMNAQGELQQPSRVLLYNAATPKATLGVFGIGRRDKDAIKVDPQCRFKNVKALSDEADKLRSCFDGAMQALAERIAADPIWSSKVNDAHPL